MPVTSLDNRTALLVIDLQKGSAARPTAPHPLPEVIARTATLAEAFRAQDLPVILTRFTFNADGSDATPGRTDLGNRGPQALPEGWDDIIDPLAGHPEDLVITKRNWGSFYGTDLDLHLRRRSITHLVITGIATSLGVESTARSAHEHGYNLTIPTDAVTDLNPEAHTHATTRIFPLIAETGTTEEVLALLKER
ncbi:isochorismatase family protein [Glycomyces dulcitolivorans]|uniref:isochorismatase family protein n=1 Tax=Glycomyces dulcitolivorans TaxID=2200759 RepID=UPI000DD321EB|nr:isochorismatase family protein [Glycomyces dulcitolivorans]